MSHSTSNNNKPSKRPYFANSTSKLILLAVVILAFVVIALWAYTQTTTFVPASEPPVIAATNQPATEPTSIGNETPLPTPINSASKAATSQCMDHVEKLVVAGPMASVSNPLLRLTATDTLSDVADTIEFRQWRDPSQMRAMILKGDVDFIALPTNVAANLFNKGVDLKLLNVSVWGILYVVSNDEHLSNLSQLKGKELVMPFRGDMPDITVQRLLKAQGLSIGDDINIRYVANPMAAMQMLMTQQADYAVLVEPAVSMALHKSQSLPTKAIAPKLYRSIDLQQEWGQAFNSEPKVPQAGIAVVNSRLSPKLIDRFVSEYDQALQWSQAHPKEAADLIVKEIPMLNKQAIAQSIGHVNMTAVPAKEAQPELEDFFKKLAQLDDKLIGGKLPDDSFYYPTVAN